MPVGTEKDKPLFGAWLRREMERRGYETEGPRAGGRTRLASETGISLSVISRILIDNRIPEIKALRAIGELFGYSLGEMLVYAGLADSDELSTSVIVGPATSPSGDAPTVDIPPEVDLESAPDWERHLWLTPGLTLHERRMAILFLRLSRGDLRDVDALLDFKHAVDEVVSRELKRGHRPNRAS